MNRWLGGFAAAALGAAAADAATAQEAAVFYDVCKTRSGQILAPAVVIDALLAGAKVPWSQEVIDARARTLAPTAGGAGLAALSSTEARRNLVNLTSDVIEQLPRATDVRVSATVAPGDPYVLAEQYLSGDFAVLTVRCGQPRADATAPRTWVVGGSVSDVTANSAELAGFATFSYVNDDEDVVEATAFVGRTFGSEFGRVTPYVGYERRTKSTDPLNDLTFGIAAVIDTAPGHELGWRLDYETDDDLNSEMWLATVDWRFPTWPICRDDVTDEGQDQILLCHLTLKIDYADVRDAGDKASLATVEQFFRAGASLRVAFGREIQGGSWVWAALDYDVMRPIDGDDGAADRWRVSMDWVPTKTSNFKFGVSYESGEDVSSLTPVETFKASLGVRY